MQLLVQEGFPGLCWQFWESLSGTLATCVWFNRPAPGPLLAKLVKTGVKKFPFGLDFYQLSSVSDEVKF